ncbi:hypothetical protein ACQP2K_21535 [Microbispora siamensis]
MRDEEGFPRHAARRRPRWDGVGESADVGGAIGALLADGSGWITGQRVEASGGIFL